MSIKSIHKLIPFRKLLAALLIFSFVVQVIIISYNHYSGFYTVLGFKEFLIRLSFSTLLTSIAGGLLAYPDLYLIHKLNSKFKWQDNIVKRGLIEFILTLLIAAVIATLITNISHLIDAYYEDFSSVLVNNILISSVINLILIIFLEARIFFIESKRAKNEKEIIKNELSQIKFEILKNQINPHFLFNSLNVLSGLIDEDAERAQEFLDEFSHIYRYVLETIDKKIISIKNEVEFAKSYIYLQQIRYSSNLNFSLKIDSEMINHFIPPLSLQLVLENAIKHNIISEEKPLNIEITNDNEYLIIKNNLQTKTTNYKSNSLGQENLKKRYSLISNNTAQFYINSEKYIVKLPIIKSAL